MALVVWLVIILVAAVVVFGLVFAVKDVIVSRDEPMKPTPSERIFWFIFITFFWWQ
jgi:hypothetical protein